MDERDVFAVWLADAVPNTSGDPFGAATLNQMLEFLPAPWVAPVTIVRNPRRCAS
jgi:hypothetical protein